MDKNTRVPGELIALRCPKVDWLSRKARIDANVAAKTFKRPKTDAGAGEVELNDEAIAALTGQKGFTFHAGEQVFFNPRTGKPWETEAKIRKTLWLALCARAPASATATTPTKCAIRWPAPC